MGIEGWAADGLLSWIDHHSTCAIRLGMFAADQLPLDEELPIDGLERAHIDVNQLAFELPRLVQGLDAAA